MRISQFALIAIIAMISITGCKKESNQDPLSPTNYLSIKMNPVFLTAMQVDSAYAIWKTDEGTQRVPFAISHDSLLIDVNELKEGNGELSFEIFSNKKYNNQYRGQWFSKTNVLIQKTKGVHYKGPDSFNDSNWFPRIELKDAIGHIAVVALRPDDPYFFVNKPNHPSIRLAVDRGYWKTVGGIQLAGRDVWECTSNCFETANTNFFTSLPVRIGQKPWNHISITLLFEVDDTGGGWILNFEYDL